MNGTDIPVRRRLSRETRNLLIAACVALVALWILARLRFPDQPVTPNPISPVLTQMSAQPAFAALASEVTRVRNRLAGLVIPVPDAPSAPDAPHPDMRPALVVGTDTAALLLGGNDPHATGTPDFLVADRASGLALVRAPARSSTSSPIPWAPVQLDAPRFLIMTIGSDTGLAFQPVFVGSLTSYSTPAWSAPVWLVPAGTEIPPGAFLFTNDSELVGMAVEEAGRLAIVPGETLLADARRLLERGPSPAGTLGIEAQPLTDATAAATRAAAGVVVSWVAPEGPAAGQFRPGDVIEAIDGLPILSLREWEVRSRRLSAGDAVAIEMRRGGELQTVELTATAAEMPQERALGLTLRVVTGVGSEVVRVEPGSAAEAAGIVRGDIITVIGTTTEPTPARIRLAFASTEDPAPLLVAFTRGDSHHVTALAR